MNHDDTDVRELFERMARESTLSPVGAPPQLLRRARRRAIAGATILAIVIAIVAGGAAFGIGKLRAPDRKVIRPAPAPSIVSVSPVSDAWLLAPNRGVVLTNGRFMATRDGGRTWKAILSVSETEPGCAGDCLYGIQAVAHTPDALFVVQSIGPAEGPMVGTRFTMIPVTTCLAGPSCTPWSHVFPGTFLIQQVTLGDAGHAWVATSHLEAPFNSQNPGLYRTTDGGRTWQVSTPPSRPTPAAPPTYDFQSHHFRFFSDRLGFDAVDDSAIGGATGYVRFLSDHSLFRSTDGGQTWSKVALTVPPHRCRPSRLVFYGGSTLHEGIVGTLLCGLQSQTKTTWLYPISPAGAVGAPRQIAVPSYIGPIVEADAATWFVNTPAHQLGVSHDGGRSWTLMQPPGFPHADDLALSFSDGQHGWAVMSCCDLLTLYATSDGGLSWTPVITPEVKR